MANDNLQEEEVRAQSAAHLLITDMMANNDIDELVRSLSIAIDVDSRFNWYMWREVLAIAGNIPREEQFVNEIKTFLDEGATSSALDNCVYSVRNVANISRDKEEYLRWIAVTAAAAYQTKLEEKASTST